MLAIGAVFKNETHIMIEWIEHYFYHGVDDIYLIDDHSTDNIQTIKNHYINNPHVIFFESIIDSGPYERQIDIYNTYLLPHIKKYDWFGIFDLDEFLYAPNYVSFKDALKLVPEDINQIHINWVTFGSNGLLKQPTSVVEGFTKRIADIANPNYKSHKSMFKTMYLNTINIHDCNVSGKSENYSYMQNNNNPLFLLNHYVIQSKGYFDNVKARRGDVNKIVGTNYRDDNYFLYFDQNDTTDNRLYEQNKDLINKIKPTIIHTHKNISFCVN